MKTVTGIINDAHLSTNNTLGQPANLPIYGWPLVPPINLTSAYAFDSIEELGSYHENKYNSVRYARDSSLLVRQIENYFSLLHNDTRSLLFNSGMAALSACFNSSITAKTKIFTFGHFYRKSYSIFEDFSEKFSIPIFNYTSYKDMLKTSEPDNDLLIFVESPSNPFLRLADIKAIRARYPKAVIIFDNTFQGLLNSTNQFECVDIVVMSCTKYIGGHNDILGGVVICYNDDLYPKLWNERSMRGGIIDNFTAYLLLRSLRTYDIRIKKSLENTEIVLDFLNNAKVVQNIFYPGRFENNDQEEIFKHSQIHGGSVVTFRTQNSVPLEENIKNLCSTKMAPSFGSVDSLIEIPVYMSHWGKTKEQIASLGLDERTVRFSVGNEPIEYILDDLEKFLKY